MSKVTIEVDFNFEIRLLNQYQAYKEEGDWQGMETMKIMLNHMGIRVEGINDEEILF